MSELGAGVDSDSATAWRDLSSPDDVSAALVDLYQRRGGGRYEEVVTQTEHALQSGAWALAAGADDHLVAAAFLHDIGHLLMDEDLPARQHQDLHHEEIGGRFLANWFSDRVVAPIKLHVPAKRYLCATDTGYLDELSPASVHSLALQGGPMSDDEAKRFSDQAFASEATRLRRWDDRAKEPGTPTPPLELFAELVADVLRPDPVRSPR